MVGFPGGSLGREGGRGGGGGGVGLTDEGVVGRTGEEEPAEHRRAETFRDYFIKLHYFFFGRLTVWKWLQYKCRIDAGCFRFCFRNIYTLAYRATEEHIILL